MAELLERRFERLVAELFRRLNFEVVEQPSVDGGFRPDLLVRSRTGRNAVIEVKLYRSRTVSVETLTAALRQLDRARQAFRTYHGILVVGGRLSPAAREVAESARANIIIYDIDTLAFLFGQHAQLFIDFENITRDAFAFSDSIELQPTPVSVVEDLSRPLVAPPENVEKGKGDHLCAQLRKIPAGKSHSTHFEICVAAIVQYLFDQDLTAWSPQKTSTGGISRYDLIARVSSKHDFWNSIANHFKSRYILFECKNHGKKIKQGDIYTTEKYLYLAALRSCAIKCTRLGADKNAIAAAHGALRENGKLIMILDIEDLCRMLHLKDAGDDPNTVLVDRIDETLMRIER